MARVHFGRAVILELRSAMHDQHLRVSQCVYSRLKEIDICSTKSTKRGTKGFGRIRIPSLVNTRPSFTMRSAVSAVNYNNLIAVPLESSALSEHGINSIAMCLINARSVCNKTLILQDFIIDNKLDCCIITESWLKGDNRDDVITAELLPPGFVIKHKARPTRGGGVAILLRDTVGVLSSATPSFNSFEVLECKLDTTPPLRLIAVYRPPPSGRQPCDARTFIVEFSNYLEHIVMSPGAILIAGDFNYHVDNSSDADAVAFLRTLDSLGLEQRVKGSTHCSGHTLDLVITRKLDSLNPSISIGDGVSDHQAVKWTLDMSLEKKPIREIQYRRVKSISLDDLTGDIQSSPLMSLSEDISVDEIVHTYNSTMMNLLDRHAPLRVCHIPSRPDPEWYSMEIREAKQKRRRAERQWQRSKLTVHREIYQLERTAVNSCIRQAKRDYYNDKIESVKKDSKKLFGIVNNLLGRKSSLTLPSNSSNYELVTRFNEFFLKKVDDIKSSIGYAHAASREPMTEVTLTCWEPVSADGLLKVLKSASVKSCRLDPLPTCLLVKCLDPLLPVILRLVNQSLSDAKMPVAFKTAQVVPLLKKPSLDPDLMKNYRPVSNLPFLSKIIEKVIATQLQPLHQQPP